MKAHKSNNYLYNKHLKQLARKLRKDGTSSEIKMWSEAFKLKKRKGYTFTRQRPVLNYIVDFMCKELLLIIELDGVTHTYDKVYSKDREKDSELEAVGFKVIRFEDEDVMNQFSMVIEKIDNTIEERELELNIENSNPKKSA